MSWTFLGLKELDPILQAYEAELDQRFVNADSDTTSQRILNENRAWKKFNQTIQKFEGDGSDPRDNDQFRTVRDGRRRFPNFYEFRQGHYRLVYRRDPVTRTVMPMLVYHIRDRAKRLKAMLDLFSAG